MSMPPSRLRLSGGPTGARAIGLVVVALLLAPSAARPADLDGDGVPDASDNCPANVNPHQENSDGSGVGDVCDPAAINAVLERIAAPGSDYHGRTPYYG